MRIDQNILTSFKDFDTFDSTFVEYAKETGWKAVLFPIISKVRLKDAHTAWLEDLSRVADHEVNINGDLDHFKQCGHLAYWLRRMAPIVEFVDMAVNFGEEGGFMQMK